MRVPTMEVNSNHPEPTLQQSSNSLQYRKYSFLTKRTMSFERVTPTGFGNLPIPVLVNIFKHLDTSELLRIFSFVCKHWRYAVMQPELIKSFHVYGYAVDLPYIYDHLRKFKLLQALHIEKRSNPTAILLQASKFLRHLKRLSLKDCHDLDFMVLRYIITAFPQLQMFSLEKSNFKGPSPRYSVISCLTCLRSLNLSKIKNITMNNILETVLNCRYLEELNIGLLPPLVDLKDEDACLIISNIAPNLKSLTIDSRSLTNRTYEKLFDCPNLKKLFINYGVNLTGEFLLNFWRYLPNIEQLGFSHNCIITGDDVKQLFSAGSGIFEKITCLDFTHCVLVGDDGIDGIATCCKKLREIHLKSCRSVTNIDNLCTKCRDLRLLNVAFCLRLKATFPVPKWLEQLILHESVEFDELLERIKCRKALKIYMAESEYTDDLVRL